MPETYNRQLHGVGNLAEYFMDSIATTCRIRIARRDCMIGHPIAKTSIPKRKAPIPTPTSTGNPRVAELAAVAPPTINNTIPPNIHITEMKPEMISGVLEENVRLIFSIDC